MMEQQTGDQSRLFFALNLDELIAKRHLLRRINPNYSECGPRLESGRKPTHRAELRGSDPRSCC